MTSQEYNDIVTEIALTHAVSYEEAEEIFNSILGDIGI